ncbi:MAG TPA: hypothetical protein VNT75_12925 [Symbiobacteriaceae bacterium]|nr:hypothetical protein [Symbiobacteriaceae bacterium]
MVRPIEAVMADAQQRLETTGRLDVAAYVSAYPEHAAELTELLPVMLTLHQEKRWQAAESASRSFAVGLFAQLAAPAEAVSPDTLGSLFSQELSESGETLEEQARRTGLPVKSLEALLKDPTPVSALDNATIKKLADRVAAPFAALAKEFRRVKSLWSLSNLEGGMVFTRDKETSSLEEQKALRAQVRKATRKPPEEK